MYTERVDGATYSTLRQTITPFFCYIYVYEPNVKPSSFVDAIKITCEQCTKIHVNWIATFALLALINWLPIDLTAAIPTSFIHYAARPAEDIYKENLIIVRSQCRNGADSTEIDHLIRLCCIGRQTKFKDG